MSRMDDAAIREANGRADRCERAYLRAMNAARLIAQMVPEAQAAAAQRYVAAAESREADEAARAQIAEVEGLRAEVAVMTSDRDEAHAILADAAAAFAAGDMERVRLDLCDRYARTRAAKLNRQRAAEVARLRAAALPEDAIERGAKWLVENNANRYGRSWEDTPECQRDDARSTAADMIAALRGAS